MPLFARRRARRGHTARTAAASAGAHSTRARKDPDRVAGGYKAALANPNTTREGREHAKLELAAMGRGAEAHVPLSTKIKRALGIRSTPRRRRREGVY